MLAYINLYLRTLFKENTLLNIVYITFMKIYFLNCTISTIYHKIHKYILLKQFFFSFVKVIYITQYRIFNINIYPLIFYPLILYLLSSL